MACPKQNRSWTFGVDLWVTVAAVVLALLMIVLATQVHAQTFTVLHSFTGGADGGNPAAGLVMERRTKRLQERVEDHAINGCQWPVGGR